MRLNGDELRDLEQRSIRAWVTHAASEGYLVGRVLDWGCGRQPYRDIVLDGGGEYFGFDLERFPANVSRTDVDDLARCGDGGRVDAILCTQVLQYVEDVPGLLANWRLLLQPGGCVVLTGPTNWPEVEPEDLQRFTTAGIRRLLEQAGLQVVELEQRGFLPIPGFGLATGYGAIARNQ